MSAGESEICGCSRILEEIRRRTNIPVFNQRLTLADRELHTGDIIPPNCTIILRFQSRGGPRSHGLFQCLDVLAYVLQALTLSTVYERTLRTYMQVSTNWHLQVHFSLEQSQWGRAFKTMGNNAAEYIERQYCRFIEGPLEISSLNTVLELMFAFSANRQTCMAGIEYLWTALDPPSGVCPRIFTDCQTCSVLNVAMRTLRLHGYQRTPWDPRPSLFPEHHDPEMRGDGACIYLCLELVVALVHSVGWTSLTNANPHPGPGEFPELCPDLRFFGAVLVHFYKDMSLTIGPADGSPPQFRDHLASEWGQIQLLGANALQRLLKTLDPGSLRTLLGGLGNQKWHRLGTQWCEIRMECAVLGAASNCRTDDKMTIAIGTLLEKYPFSEDDFLVHGDWMNHWIGEMIQFEGSGETGTCILPLVHGCRALSNILRIPRCKDFVSADCRLDIISAIVESLVSQTDDNKEWHVHEVKAVGQTIIHCSLGVPTLPFQRALVAAIHALWDTGGIFPNRRTLTWTFWWMQWLSSLFDKGLWTRALVVECNGIEKLVLLYKTWRSDITIVKIVLHILTWLSTDKDVKEEIMRVEGWKIPLQAFEYCRRIPHPGAAPLTLDAATVIQLALDLLCNLANLIQDSLPLLDVVDPPPTSWIGVPVWNLLLGIQLALTDPRSSPTTLAVGCLAYAQLTSVYTGICDSGSLEEDHWLLITREHAPDLPRESFCLHYPFGGFEDTRIRVGAALLEGLMKGVSKTVLQLEGNISHQGYATVGRHFLSALVPPGWARNQQSLTVNWIHKASGATCPEFPLVMELSVRIFAAAHIDRYAVSIWIPWQCTLTDLAKLLPLRGVHSDAMRSAITFFTRLPGQWPFERPQAGSVQIRTLLGQKDAMAIPEGVPLSAVDEDNRLTILARVPPRQEGALDDHA